MYEQFIDMLKKIQQLETADARTLAVKLFEEGGELSAATLYDSGYCQHKAPNEKAMGEAADVIICVLGVISKLEANKGKSADEILDDLRNNLHNKFRKYERIMATYDRAPEGFDQTEDAAVFGDGRYVYCSQHRRVHITGWCTVGIPYKTLLTATELREAAIEAQMRGLIDPIGADHVD